MTDVADLLVRVMADVGGFLQSIDDLKDKFAKGGLVPAPDYLSIDWTEEVGGMSEGVRADPWVQAKTFRSKATQKAIAEREQVERDLQQEALEAQRANEPFGKVYAQAYPEEEAEPQQYGLSPFAPDPFGYNLAAPARYIYPVLTAFKFTPFRNKIPRIYKPPAIAMPTVWTPQHANCKCVICLDPTHVAEPEPPDGYDPDMVDTVGGYSGLLDWLRSQHPGGRVDVQKDIDAQQNFLLHQIAKTFQVDIDDILSATP